MLRIGVIGYGYWGPNLVRNFSKLEDCRVTALADMDESKRAAARRAYPGLETFSHSSQLLAEADVDAVAIATPMATHYELAREALSRGKHVLIEKPMTASTAEALKLIELARQMDRTLMVDHTFVYTGAIRKLRRIIDSGELGEIFYYDSVRVNLGLFQHDLSVLWDLAPHDFSIMDYLIGKQPLRVSAVGAAPLRGNGYGLESIVYVTVEFEDDTLAHFHVNWLSPVKVRRTLIGGSRKMVIYDHLEPDYQIKIVDKGVEILEDEDRYNALIQYRTGDLLMPKVDQTEALEHMCRHFADCIRKQAIPVSDGQAGLRVVRLLESAQKSIEEFHQSRPLVGEQAGSMWLKDRAQQSRGAVTPTA